MFSPTIALETKKSKKIVTALDGAVAVIENLSQVFIGGGVIVVVIVVPIIVEVESNHWIRICVVRVVE